MDLWTKSLLVLIVTNELSSTGLFPRPPTHPPVIKPFDRYEFTTGCNDTVTQHMDRCLRERWGITSDKELQYPNTTKESCFYVEYICAFGRNAGKSCDLKPGFSDSMVKLSQTVGTQKMRKFRDHIMSKSLADSPFNVRVILNPFLNTFASIYKFLAKVDPILPVPHKQEDITILKSCYTQMDTDFEVYMNANMTFDFQIDSMDSRFIHLQQNFEVFYTLKLYFFAFEIQKHCINSVLKFNHRSNHKVEQLCQIFKFIWKNSMIEQKYRNSYPGEVLFESPDSSQVFNEFYVTYLSRAEVLDHLVYYLAKISCSVLLRTVALFLQPMHALQRCSHCMCKPGWVPLFKILDTVLSALDEMETTFISYDDEFNRI